MQVPRQIIDEARINFEKLQNINEIRKIDEKRSKLLMPSTQPVF